MISICHVQVLPLLSGVQNAMLDLLDHLDRDVIEPHVVCQSTGPLTEALARRRIPCHIVPSFGRAIRPWRDARAFTELKRLFSRHRFQLVHNHSAKPRAIGTFAARQARVPAIVNHVQGYPFHERTSAPVASMYRRIESAVARRSDLTVFVNHEDEKNAIATRLAPADRCATVYNSVDLDRFAPDATAGDRCRLQLGLPSETTLITVLGRLEEQKQPLILPKIAAKLESLASDVPWKIVVAGDGALRAKLESHIQAMKLEHRFRLAGWVENPIALLHATDVLLLPSLWEGLPVALIEAHAAGVPCVASDIRGNNEVVCQETGRLATPTDADAYAVALQELVTDSFTRQTLGIAARRRAESLFNTETNNRKMCELYGRLLGSPIPMIARTATKRAA